MSSFQKSALQKVLARALITERVCVLRSPLWCAYVPYPDRLLSAAAVCFAQIAMRSLIVATAVGVALGDVYMHNPRGSNDRNCERNVNRNNGNRLFDSQNNAKGYAALFPLPSSLPPTPPAP